MITNVLQAANGYVAARPQVQPDADGGAGFAATLWQGVENVTDRLVRHETVARAAIMGQADPHALVEALAATQSAVEQVSAVRDRVVEAYQEILRMPV
jgi:flagellar hook-basal body complex protein FliE